MASITCGDKKELAETLRILEPACGSGRMLVASSRVLGPEHHYYGIDLDNTCVRTAAINMFLNGIFHGEVMCANALDPDDFRVSYKMAMFPFGVFRITEREQSPLWHLHHNSFLEREPLVPSKGTDTDGIGSQLSFF